MVIGCFVAGLYCFALLLSRYHKQTLILAGVALVGLQPYLLGFKNLLLPDLPFMLFVLLCLYFIQLLDEPDGQENQIAIGLTAGVCMFYAASLRTIGVSILGAAFLLYLLRRRFPPRGIILACAVAVLLLVIQTELMPKQPGYASQVAASVSGQSADSIVMLRLRHIRAMFVATEPLWHSAFLPATVVLMCASTGLAVIGFVSRLRSASILETFCISYVGLLFVWPWVQTRYMIPLVPLLVHYAIMGFGVVSRAVPRTARAAGLGLVALVTLVYAENLIGADRAPFQDGATGEAALEMYSYVTRCTAVDARFVFSRPRALALFTGRQAMAPAVRFTDLEDVVEQGRIDYVVAFRDGAMDHLSAERPDIFQLVFRNDRHVVYRYASDELPGRKPCDASLSSAPL
jgi:hypothetical protein